MHSTPSCQQCRATYRALDGKGIEYQIVDLIDRPDLVETFKAEGLAQAPVVVTDTDRWSGFRPDKIATL